MLLWADLETTGLYPTEDFILEVAWTRTNDFHGSHPPIQSRVITPSIATWFRIEDNQFIQDMHGPTGLLDALTSKDTVELWDAESEILADITDAEKRGDEMDWRLAGSSVHFDQAFIARHMPRLADRLSHRIYDVTTLRLFAETREYLVEEPENENQHRAANDIAYSLGYANNFHEAVRSRG